MLSRNRARLLLKMNILLRLVFLPVCSLSKELKLLENRCSSIPGFFLRISCLFVFSWLVHLGNCLVWFCVYHCLRAHLQAWFAVAWLVSVVLLRLQANRRVGQPAIHLPQASAHWRCHS